MSERERVFCPYCPADAENPEGVEMMIREARQARSREAYLVQYMCKTCGACTPAKSGETAEKAKASVLAMIQKAMPTRQKQKPLTWWEACEDDYYLEIKGGEYVDMALLQTAFCTDDAIMPSDYAMFTTHEQDGLELYGADYGKTWRCWKTRPTEEERAAAKWDLEAEEAQSLPEAQAEPAAKKEDAPFVVKFDTYSDNQAFVSGYLVDGLKVTHSIDGTDMYEGVIVSRRGTSTHDKINIILPADALEDGMPDLKNKVVVRGQVRLYSAVINGNATKVVKVFAREIHPYNSATDVNLVALEGIVNRQPGMHQSTDGKAKCLFSLEVDRGSAKKFDYIQCVAWAKNAIALQDMRVGEWLSTQGRIQSYEVDSTDANGRPCRITHHNVSIINYKREREA